MAALTIAGIDLAVVEGTWVRKPSLYQGGRARMRDNSLRSTETAEVRVWECQVDFEDATEEETFRTAVTRGVPTTVAGDLPDASFDGTVDLSDAQVNQGVLDGVEVFWRTVTLHIEESEPA